MIRVVLADDQALVRGAFVCWSTPRTTWRSWGEATDGAEAVELALRLRPDVVLMDIRMPGVDGVEATRAEELVLSPATARTHVSRAISKLGARDRAQLVVLAYETGLVTAHP
jgi:DNA-binding NarL/FixJ family response regulator